MLGQPRSWAYLLGLIALVVIGALVFTLVTTSRTGSPERKPVLFPGVELSAVAGVSVKMTAGTGGYGISQDGDRFEASGIPIRDLIGHAYSIPPGGMAAEVEYPQGVFDVSVDPKGTKTVTELLAAALGEVFGLRAAYEKRVRSVFLLRHSQGRGSLSPIVAGSRLGTSENSRDHLHTVKFRGDMADFSSWLQESLEMLVFDETGLSGSFEILLSWDDSPGNTLIDALRTHGFSLEPSQRSLEVLVVRGAR